MTSLLLYRTRPLTSGVTFADIVAEWDDADIEAYADSNHARWDHFLQTGDSFSAEFLRVRLDIVTAEQERRVKARERHADNPRPPFWTDDKDRRYRRTRELADYLRNRWPIEQFMRDLMAIDLAPVAPTRMKGRCPFHDDHDPSMTVYADQGTFFCFSCREFGDVFDCVGQYFDITGYLDQIEKLAEATPDLPERFKPQRNKSGAKRRGVRLQGGKVVAA